MAEPSLFGIGKQTWDLINSFANWFAAFGSFAAAGVALYLANKSSKPTARVSVGHRIVIGQGIPKESLIKLPHEATDERDLIEFLN